MTASCLTLPVLLSADLTRELSERLDAAFAEQVTTYTGMWCRESKFAVFILLAAGLPVRWHITGPLQQAEAEGWLASMAGSAEAMAARAEQSGKAH